MAIKRIGASRWTGTSFDIKPAAVDYGSTFYETDTEKEFVKTQGVIENNGWKETVAPAAEDTNSVGGALVVVEAFGYKYLVTKKTGTNRAFEVDDVIEGQVSPILRIVAKILDPAWDGTEGSSDIDIFDRQKIYVP